MKKIIALILCLMILCVPVVAAAEGGDVTEGEASGDISTPEVETPVEEEIQPPVETPVETPAETPEEIPETMPEEEIETPVETPEDIPTETPDEIPEEIPEETPENPPVETPEEIPEEIPEQKPEETPEETPEEKPEEKPTETPPVEEPPVEEPPVETPKEETTPTFEEEVNMVSEQIKEWIVSNLDSISIIITLISTCVVTFVKLKTTINSARTMNNNTITIAKASNDAISQALASIENASGAVTGYDTRILALLEAFKNTAEDKARLEAELVEIKNYLKTSTDANIEFANELAELLGLANIPNYKKEELGARHLERVNAILEAEKKAEAAALIPTTTEEVKGNVGEEA